MIDHVQRYVLPAAYALLPATMHSHKATAMLLAIGLQESGFVQRRQQPRKAGLPPGPARGFWQFEEHGGVKGVMRHPESREHAARVLTELRYGQPPIYRVYEALEHNDVLAAVFARLLLWTLPDALPGRLDPAAAWHQYMAAWRPGAPHPERWATNYAEAWRQVES